MVRDSIAGAVTALFLVVMMASRGLSGTDHVDGKEDDVAAPPSEGGAP